MNYEIRLPEKFEMNIFAEKDKGMACIEKLKK